MRQKYVPAIAIVAFLFVSPIVQAQCKAFVKSNLARLESYIHDGSYQAVMMSEGEEAEVFKTIFAGQQYRLLVCIEDVLPNVEVIVTDIRRNILFDSRKVEKTNKNENAKIWDFKSDVSQQIKVTIRIPKSEKSGEVVFGCAGVLFGLKE